MEPSETRLDSPVSIRAAVEALFLDDSCSPEITFLLCDSEDRVFVASPCDDAPPHPTLEECRTAADVFAGSLAPICPGGGLLFVITRPSPATVTEGDRHWHHAIHEACAAHQIRAVGVWLVTPGRARELAAEDVVA